MNDLEQKAELKSFAFIDSVAKIGILFDRMIFLDDQIKLDDHLFMTLVHISSPRVSKTKVMENIDAIAVAANISIHMVNSVNYTSYIAVDAAGTIATNDESRRLLFATLATISKKCSIDIVKNLENNSLISAQEEINKLDPIMRYIKYCEHAFLIYNEHNPLVDKYFNADIFLQLIYAYVGDKDEILDALCTNKNDVNIKKEIQQQYITIGEKLLNRVMLIDIKPYMVNTNFEKLFMEMSNLITNIGLIKL